MARGLYVICEGTDKRQTLADIDQLRDALDPGVLDQLLDAQPEGWIRITLTRQQGVEPEVLDFASFAALAEWASRAQPLHQLKVGRAQG